MVATSLVIKNGLVVSKNDTARVDVLLEDGLISRVDQGIPTNGRRVVDASDAYVVPGAVDPHVHIQIDDDPNMDAIIERVDAATRAALHGGTTTVGLYVRGVPGKPPEQAIREQIDEALRSASVDFFLNLLCTPADRPQEIVPKAVHLGVRNFKALLAYKSRGLMSGDAYLLELMEAVKRASALLLVHPENGSVIEYLESREREREAQPSRAAFLRTAPGVLEAEGITRTVLLSRMVGCRVLFVHMSSREAVEVAAWVMASDDGNRIMWETQPHYLMLTNNQVLERGALAKVGPPLREQEDVDAVWAALQNGWISHLSSDHAPRTVELKMRTPDILAAPYGGTSGIELVLALAHAIGPEAGRFDVARMVQLTSTNAAKAYGLYPRKGAITRGAEADLALIPIDGPSKSVSPENLHGLSDYSLYVDTSSRGFPRTVIRHGQIVIEEGLRTDAAPPPRYLIPASRADTNGA